MHGLSTVSRSAPWRRALTGPAQHNTPTTHPVCQPKHILQWVQGYAHTHTQLAPTASTLCKPKHRMQWAQGDSQSSHQHNTNNTKTIWEVYIAAHSHLHNLLVRGPHCCLCARSLHAVHRGSSRAPITAQELKGAVACVTQIEGKSSRSKSNTGSTDSRRRQQSRAGHNMCQHETLKSQQISPATWGANTAAGVQGRPAPPPLKHTVVGSRPHIGDLTSHTCSVEPDNLCKCHVSNQRSRTPVKRMDTCHSWQGSLGVVFCTIQPLGPATPAQSAKAGVHGIDRAMLYPIASP